MVRHNPGVDVPAEREDRDGWPPDREARRGDNRRRQTLKALARFRQFGRNARAVGMHFDADMVGNEPNDPLRIGRRHAAAGILNPARQPIDPEAAIGIEHDLDDAGIF